MLRKSSITLYCNYATSIAFRAAVDISAQL